MKSPQEILKERLQDNYNMTSAEAAECARTLLDDLQAYYNITELPYLAQKMGAMIREIA